MANSSSKIHFLILLLVCGLIFFTNLKSWHPTIMEARNFISAREMVDEGSWLIPTLNGEIRIRKPPLPTWLTAIAIKISNAPNDLTVLRIPAALIATLGVFFIYGLVRELFKENILAFYAGLVLATCFMFAEEGRTGAWDIFCNSFMVGGLWMFYKGYNRANGYTYFALSGILLGFSFLSKGPVAFYAMLLPFFLALFISKEKSYESNQLKGILLCIAIAVALSIAWPLYLFLNLPDLASRIAVEEANAWIEKHNRPVWYYLHFPLFTGVWTIFLLFGLARVKKLYQVFDRKKALMIFLWLLFTLLLLSIVPEKKERYMLPGIVPMAILIAIVMRYWEQVQMNRLSRFTIKFHSLLVAVICISFPYLLYRYGIRFNMLEWQDVLLISIVFLTSSGILLYHSFKGKVAVVFYSSIVIMILFTVVGFPLRPNIERENSSYENLTAIRTIPELQDIPLYTPDAINPIQLWEAGRIINVIRPGGQWPSSNAGILTFSPPEDRAKYTRIWKFRFDPENREKVVYVLLL